MATINETVGGNPRKAAIRSTSVSKAEGVVRGRPEGLHHAE